MLKPAYHIALDAAVFSASTLGPLAALEVRRSTNGAADEAVVRLGRAPDLAVAEGAAATVELGWDDNTQVVFTGTVEAVAGGIGWMEITALGEQAKLMRARGDQGFVKQKAGQVVSALAGDAGVTAGTVEDGIDLPVYLADSSRSSFDHCLALARRCGFDLYTTVDGKLAFTSFSGSLADHTLRYGERIVAVSVEKGAYLEDATVVPESPASNSGDDTASWVVKDSAPLQAMAGRGAGVLIADPVLRTKDAAEAAAKSWSAARKRDSVCATVELDGSPDIELGQTVALEGVPDAGVDGTYQVLAIRHRLDRNRGFRTLVGLGGMP